MRVYLDNCAFNRPFDDQEQIKIKIEAEAKLYIQEKIKNDQLELIWSYILDFENSQNPFEERKVQISEWKKYSKHNIIENKNILSIANELFKLNIKAKDALHIACAIDSKCQYFITTDDFLLKKSDKINEIKIISPLNFIEMEESE